MGLDLYEAGVSEPVSELDSKFAPGLTFGNLILSRIPDGGSKRVLNMDIIPKVRVME